MGAEPSILTSRKRLRLSLLG